MVYCTIAQYTNYNGQVPLHNNVKRSTLHVVTGKRETNIITSIIRTELEELPSFIYAQYNYF